MLMLKQISYCSRSVIFSLCSWQLLGGPWGTPSRTAREQLWGLPSWFGFTLIKDLIRTELLSLDFTVVQSCLLVTPGLVHEMVPLQDPPLGTQDTDTTAYSWTPLPPALPHPPIRTIADAPSPQASPPLTLTPQACNLFSAHVPGTHTRGCLVWG